MFRFNITFISTSGYFQWRLSGFDSRRYQIFWEVVVLERGPLSLVSTIEELLGRKSSGSYLENREYGRRDLPRWPRDTFYPQNLALTSPTSGGLSVGIVRSRTATELLLLVLLLLLSLSYSYQNCSIPPFSAVRNDYLTLVSILKN
jgi:hypothetical protein